MGSPTSLAIAVDLRPARTILATVAGTRVIDVRRLQHDGPAPVAEVAAAIAVLRERAPGPVTRLGVVWRPLVALSTVDRADVTTWLAALASRTSLPGTLWPAGAALARGEWLRAPVPRLGVLALGARVDGGVVVGGDVVDPATLDAGHQGLDPRGTRCPCGARGCLQWGASEWAAFRIASDLELPLPEPSAETWQTVVASSLRALQDTHAWDAEVLLDRLASAVARTIVHWTLEHDLTDVRIRTRHPDTWQMIAARTIELARVTLGSRLPNVVAADAGEDAWWVGAVA